MSKSNVADDEGFKFFFGDNKVGDSAAAPKSPSIGSKGDPKISASLSGVAPKTPSASSSSSLLQRKLPPKAPSWWTGYRENVINPGKYEDLEKEATNICMSKETFDGFLLEWRRPISMDLKKGKMFELSHSLTMGGSSPASYTFIADVTNARHKLHSRFNLTHSRVSGFYLASLGYGLTLRLVGQSSMKSIVFGSELRRKGDDYTASIEYLTNGKIECKYRQSISQSLSAGLNLIHEPMMGTILAGGFRYENKDKNYIFSGTAMSLGMATLSFTQLFPNRPNCAWATQLRFERDSPNSPPKASVAVGWSYDLMTTNLRGKIDTSGRLTCFLQEKMFPNLAFILCGDLDYSKDIYKVGIGATFHM